ncbi:MAG: hypothetical protein ACNA8W_08395 [Bradymonadaceae bacterium]
MPYFDFIGSRRAASTCTALILWITVVLFMTACKADCSPPVAETNASALVEYVPRDIPAILFSSALDELMTSLGTAQQNLPLDPQIGVIREELNRTLGFDLLDKSVLARSGFATDKPALSFVWKGQLIVVASAAEPKSFGEMLAGHESRGVRVEARTANGFDLLELTGAAHPIGALAHRRGRVLLSVPLVSPPGTPAPAEALVSLIELEEKERWDGFRAQADFVRTLDEAPGLHGVFRPGHWLGGLEAEGHAKLLLEGLVRQMGAVHFAAHFEPEGRRLRIELFTPGEAGEPVAITSLGEAEGQPPRVGGLVRPGVLGVVRLSVDPEALYNLIRSTLPAAQRSELEQFWKDMATELKVDVRHDVIGNIQGHVLVVVYGFEDRVLSADNPHLMADLFQLKATREAVLIPIMSRELLEPILDVATQLSRGNLRRQVIRHTIQYAWIPDGSLEWALILNDDYILFVDSAVAFDHAIAWERSPRSLDDSLREVGLARILEEDRSGFYVDLTTLSNLFTESGKKESAAWMRPFETVVFSTGEKHSQLEFILHRD